MRQVDLIFTRDFSLFTCQFWRDRLLLKEINNVWGTSLSDQIIHFNGRLVEAYRYHDESECMKEAITHLPLTHHLFTDAFENGFKEAVSQLRELLKIENPSNPILHVQAIQEAWAAMYPGYMLANFLPGAWADTFRSVHGNSAEPIVERQLQNRMFIEGLFEQVDLYVRSFVRQALVSQGIDGALNRFVNMHELGSLLEGNHIASGELERRRSGYTVLNGDVIMGRTLREVFAEQGIAFDFFDGEEIREIKGQAAYRAESLQGEVQIVYTHEDVGSFRPGRILVTPMTAPDFVPAIKSAAAIITDEGGITCHAAIVAREMKKPCIIGTKIATKVLKDGDMIEVDTNTGTVRVLKRT